jgi:hydroxymethylbilane synthase
MKTRTPKTELRLGTRASLLALTQAGWVKSRLEALHPQITVTLAHIKTSGDKIDFPLFDVGGKGLFVKEIEEALLKKEVDLAVHSAKDLPAEIPEGLALISFPEREDPRDVFISRDGRSWRDLAPGARVGTSSLRRQAQLRRLRPDFEVVALRGNLDTRLKKLVDTPLDGIVLASAGLRRMGWGERVTEHFDAEEMLPAIGQGVLAIEARTEDERVQGYAGVLDHAPTRVALEAERAFLKKLGGGCQVPVAGLAEVKPGTVSLSGLVAGTDGKEIIRGEKAGATAQSADVGARLAEELLARGADRILREVYHR